MKQETVCAIAAELFSVSDSGASASKGACLCAIVVLPSRPPKYTLVCYNAQQVTFCVARMSWVDGQHTSLRLVVAPSGHVSFTDDTDKRWSLFFSEAAQLARFLACVGVAFYSLYGAPATSVFAHDVNLPSSSALPLQAGDRAVVAFTGFQLREKDGVCSVGATTQERGESGDDHQPPHHHPGSKARTPSEEGGDSAPYVFQPKPSAAQLSHGCFGFEGSVIGMREDERRVFVVPAGYTTRVSEALTNVAAEGAVYVVQLLRVEHVRGDDDDSRAAASTDQGSEKGKEKAAAAAAAPPAVYAATAEADPPRAESRAVALVGHAGSSTLDSTTVTSASVGAPTAASAVPAYLSPSGIPPEHMSVLRKVELGVTAAVTSARDVHDVAAIFSQEWRQHVERPKPSLLSNKALLEQVQRVVTEEETAQAHLDECDRLYHALEGRNKELQQRIDRATVESQKLLEEKNGAATKAMDARLEQDRQLVRLKDALLLRRQEREDLQRHINALQRAADVSNEELRQVQGRRDVHQVEVRSMAERLSAMQETLSEERHRNAALAAKISATEESLKKAQAQQRVAEGQLTTARGLAEKARLRYVQIMEEERHHRAQDAELLRQDILHELDARERQFQVDRRRVAEEEFGRGLRDGKAEGRQAAATDLAGHQDELRLTLQRAKTEVETTKEEVRASIESAMALRRTLGNKVSDLEEQLVQATRRHTQLQYGVAQWQTRCRTVRDTIGEHWRTLTSYATHPCTRAELLALMKEVRRAEERSYADDVDDEDALVRVDLQFQQHLWQQSRRQSVEQRLRWVAADMAEMYEKGLAYHFAHEWSDPVTAAHAATLEAVAQLYAHLHGSRALFDCGVQEAQERYALQQQWNTTMKGIDDWLTAQRAAQEAIRVEESKARQAQWKAFVDGGDAIVQLCAAQLRAQVLLLQEEMADREEVLAAETKLRARLPMDAQQLWAADCLAALHVLEEDEEAVRAGLEAEAYTAHSGLKFQFAYAQRGVAEAELRRSQQEALDAAEAETRHCIEEEANVEGERVRKEAAAALAPPPPPLTAYEEEAPTAPAQVADAAPSAFPPAPPPLSTTDALADGTQPAPLPPAAAAAAVEDPLSSAMKEENTSAPLHADPTAAAPPPPPPSPPASAPAPAFNLTDPPRVNAARSTVNGHNVTSAEDNSAFADEPPPLPPSDEEAEEKTEESAKAAQSPPQQQQLQRTSLPPPPSALTKPTLPAHSPPKAVVDSTYADRDAPPPLPSDGDGAAHNRDDGAASSNDFSSSSTSSSSPPAPMPPPPPPPRTTIAEIEVPEEEEEGDTSAAAATAARPARYMFGGSSSEDEADSNDGNARSPVSAPREARSKAGPPPSAVNALTKPKLFDSSDDD